ncbi:MAG: carbohydrate porin [Bacteroidota bacterium]
MKKSISIGIIMLVTKTLLSQSADTTAALYPYLSPALHYADVNKDRVISLDEAWTVFEKYHENTPSNMKNDLTDDVEATVIELISYLEGINCNDLKKTEAARRFIEVYFANKFFDGKENPFGATRDSINRSKQPEFVGQITETAEPEQESRFDKYFCVGGIITSFYQAPFGFKQQDPESTTAIRWRSENIALFTVPVDIMPWRGATFNISPEYAGGNGVGDGVGFAAYPNSIYGIPQATPYLVRAQYKQHLEIDTNRNSKFKSMELLLGKFIIQEAFDMNEYASDPTNDFLNFNHTMLSAWDAATTGYGFTYGGALKFNLKKSQINFAAVTVNKDAGGPKADLNIKEGYSINLQYARKLNLGSKTANVRLLTFYNKANSGAYSRFTCDSSGTAFFCDSLKAYRGKYGFGIDADIKLSDNLAIFGRYSWNDGKSESMGYTEADQALAGGAVYSFGRIKRPNDLIGAALSVNALSKGHSDFLKNGGSGFMLGDGSLNYKTEQAFEFFYKTNLIKIMDITFNYQYIINSGYNADRGNIHFWGCRLNFEF